MLRRALFLIAAGLLAGGIARGQYIVSVDLLSPGDAGYESAPPNTICVDVLATFPNWDVWTAGGLRGLASSGAQLLYAPDPNDPEMPRLVNPGLDYRYTTFVSYPRLRNSNVRFLNGAVQLAGAYDPPAPLPIANESEINVAYFRSPPETDVPTFPAYVARVALDVSSVIGAPTDIAEWFVTPLALAPEDAVFIFRSERPGAVGSDLGTVSATFEHANLFGLDWGVWYVPEPSTFGLVLIGAGLALARRRLTRIESLPH